jgi:hypothetical protein
MICSGLSQNTRGVLDMKSSAALRTKFTGTAPNVLRFRFLQKLLYKLYMCISPVPKKKRVTMPLHEKF